MSCRGVLYHPEGKGFILFNNYRPQPYKDTHQRSDGPGRVTTTVKRTYFADLAALAEDYRRLLTAGMSKTPTFPTPTW